MSPIKIYSMALQDRSDRVRWLLEELHVPYENIFLKKKNGEMNMKNRQFGFEDGYNACLEDLGIQLTYKNDR